MPPERLAGGGARPGLEPGLALLPLRIFLGATFVYGGIQKLSDPGFLHKGAPTYIGAQLHAFASGTPGGFILRSLALPHPALSGVAVALAEIVIGLLALTGLLTRAAAVGGLGLSLLLFLTASWKTSPYFLGSDIVFVFAWLPFTLAGARGQPALDHLIHKRPPTTSLRPAGGSEMAGVGVGPELTRRAIDLIAPIGYGQRALIVAPARAGKTMLLQAIVEGVAINHPQAVLLVLLVDERPEEVSEMITWGYGEVVASSFDMPAVRHTDVTEMVLERARRMVELGKDVVIVLDSITRMARAYNTVERGTGRTLSGGLDATAMAKPKAFFGSARSVAPEHGGGSLTIIATALVETGSRMDDVIFEEFKGTGNCEIKLDRSLAEKRIFPAIDVSTSGTRREDKLFKPTQLEHVYTLRRGLQQMPSTSAMEWLIKRIAATPNNDALLEGL